MIPVLGVHLVHAVPLVRSVVTVHLAIAVGALRHTLCRRVAVKIASRAIVLLIGRQYRRIYASQFALPDIFRLGVRLTAIAVNEVAENVRWVPLCRSCCKRRQEQREQKRVAC